VPGAEVAKTVYRGQRSQGQQRNIANWGLDLILGHVRSHANLFIKVDYMPIIQNIAIGMKMCNMQ